MMDNAISPVIQAIELMIARLEPASAADDVEAAIAQVDFIKRSVRDLDTSMKLKATEWIEANEPLVIGTVRYYVGESSDTKCDDPQRTVDETFKAVGGDLAKFTECLSSDPFKHGWLKSVLAPDVYATCFRTVKASELKKTDAEKRAAKRQLQKIDTNFVR